MIILPPLNYQPEIIWNYMELIEHKITTSHSTQLVVVDAFPAMTRGPAIF